MASSPADDDKPTPQAVVPDVPEVPTTILPGPKEVERLITEALGMSLEEAARKVWAHAANISRSHEDAEDLLQELFKNLANKVVCGDLRIDEGKGLSYMCRALNNIRNSAHRKDKFRLVPYQEHHDVPTLDDGPSEVTEGRETDDCLAAAVATLSVEKQKILALYLERGRSIRSIGEELNMAPSTVQSRIDSLQKDLRSYMRSIGRELR